MARTAGARDRAHGETTRATTPAERRGRAVQQRRAANDAAGRPPRAGSSLNSIADEMDAEYRRGFEKGRRSDRPAPPDNRQRIRYNRQAQRAAAPAPTRTASDALPMPSLGSDLDPARGRTLILMFVGISAVLAVGRDVIVGNPNPVSTATTATKTGGAATVKTPQHLRSLAGVFIVGTISLVLNELNAQLGVAMAGILLLDVGMSTFAPIKTGAGVVQPALFDRLGTSLFAGGTPQTATPANAIPLAQNTNKPIAA